MPIASNCLNRTKSNSRNEGPFPRMTSVRERLCISGGRTLFFTAFETGTEAGLGDSFGAEMGAIAVAIGAPEVICDEVELEGGLGSAFDGVVGATSFCCILLTAAAMAS